MIDCNLLRQYKFEEIINEAFQCSCGHTHNSNINTIYVENNAIDKIKLSLDNEFTIGKVAIVTIDSLKDTVVQELINAISTEDRQVVVYSYDDDVKRNIQSMANLFSFQEDIRFVIAVGGGVIIDFAKYFCNIRNIKLYALDCFMDSINTLTDYTVAYSQGVFSQMPSKCPDIYFIDKEVIKELDKTAIANTYGIVITKYLSIFDWCLANKFIKEKVCFCLIDLMLSAIELVSQGAEEIIYNNDIGYSHLIYGYIKMSIAISLLEKDNMFLGGEVISSKAMFMYKYFHEEKVLQEGIINMLMTSKLIRIYHLFFNSAVKDDALPPDVDERYEMLMSELGLSEELANMITAHSLSPKSYEYMKRKVDDEKIFLQDSINELYHKLPHIENVFGKLYGSENTTQLMGESLNIIKTAILLSTEIEPKFTTLTIMKYLGLLEGYTTKYR